jgi:hypothetical protein
MKREDRIMRDRILRNTWRANRQYAREHHMTDAPEFVKEYHRKMFEKAEYERERSENLKRGVK